MYETPVSRDEFAPGDSFISRALYKDLVHMNSAALVKHNTDYLEQIRLIPSCFVPIPRIMQPWNNSNSSNTVMLEMNEFILKQDEEIRQPLDLKKRLGVLDNVTYPTFS